MSEESSKCEFAQWRKQSMVLVINSALSVLKQTCPQTPSCRRTCNYSPESGVCSPKTPANTPTSNAHTCLRVSGADERSYSTGTRSPPVRPSLISYTLETPFSRMFHDYFQIHPEASASKDKVQTQKSTHISSCCNSRQSRTNLCPDQTHPIPTSPDSAEHQTTR